MRIQRLAALLVTLPLWLASAYELPNATETMKLVMEALREDRSLKEREVAATAEVGARARAAREQDYALRRPYDPKRVESLRKELEDSEKLVARYAGDLTRARIQSPEERAAKRDEAETAAKAAQEAYRVAIAPFMEEENAFRKDQAPLGEAIRALGEKFALVPQELGVETKEVQGDPVAGTATLSWLDKNRERIFHGQILLVPPQTRQLGDGELFAGKYPVILQRSGAIRLMTGNLHVIVASTNPEWGEKQRIREAVEKLVDLGGLAALATAPADNPFRTTIEQATAAREKTTERQARQQAATGDAQRALYQTRVRQQEWATPYSATQVEEIEKAMARQKQQVARLQATLAIEGIEAPEVRETKRKQAQVEREQAQKDLLAALAPLRAERVAVGQKQKLAMFALRNLTTQGVHTPADLEIVEADIDSLSLDYARIGVRWLDALRQPQASAELLLRPANETATEQGKLLGKYPIFVHEDDRLTVQVGKVTVKMHVRRTQWQSKGEILELVPKLIDLEAMAAWPAVEIDRPQP